MQLDTIFDRLDIIEIIDEAVTLARPLLQQDTKLTVTNMNHNQRLTILRGDHDRLTQMIQGLLGIAVKYTFNGVISIGARVDSRGKNMRIEIKDTGEQWRYSLSPSPV
jgi:signal transduction histidine kinase